MKEITVQDAQGRLSQLLAEACRGEVIVLTDGENQVTLSPHGLLNLEEDSPELEAELLKAANGPFTPYSTEEMRAVCQRILDEKRR
jgi:antitoxin (DNA-binding transcriptional repressor) of toxin-antitoxin stability system